MEPDCSTPQYNHHGTNMKSSSSLFLARCLVFVVVSSIALRGKVKLVGVWWVIGVDASSIIITFELSDMLAK